MSVGTESKSEPIKSLGATSVPAFLACRLQFAFAQSAPRGGTPPVAPAAIFGDVCHAALEQLVRGGELGADDWRERLADEWTEAMRAAIEQLPEDVVPQSWPGYKVARARLGNAAQRLRNLVLPLGTQAELISEEPMKALQGRLVGRPDLVVRSSDAHWIVDYKTGGVIDPRTGKPRAEYVGQLQLYAVLEHTRSGEWPTKGFLLPFAEKTVEIELDPSACEEAGDQLVAALDAYNREVPGQQPASPSPSACKWCAHAVECDAVWGACDADWAPEVLLARGAIIEKAHSALGTATILLAVSSGTIPDEQIAVTGVDPAEVPDWDELHPGATIRLAGLRKARGERTFSLAAWGRLGLEAE